MFTQLRKNRTGIILVSVLVISLVMAIIAVGILSLNVSQVMTGEEVTRSIVAEYFGRMLLWMIYYNNLSGRSISGSATQTIDGTVYTATITESPPATGNYTITVNY